MGTSTRLQECLFGGGFAATGGLDHAESQTSIEYQHTTTTASRTHQTKHIILDANTPSGKPILWPIPYQSKVTNYKSPNILQQSTIIKRSKSLLSIRHDRDGKFQKKENQEDQKTTLSRRTSPSRSAWNRRTKPTNNRPLIQSVTL
ncbi:hypothetical protein H5410_027647 [Solanum commersonii]|uniref:Uncharacterized protein n=1 Tax=Solanum commersonii TaxID=4109 RepID=A0A9J5YZR9_SOLCO|nr:hypothetical protein H5410_027647 [Solanum commersonii]